MDNTLKIKDVRDYRIIDELGKGSYGVVYTAIKKGFN